MSKLPAVDADVREIAKLLRSKHGNFSQKTVDVLTNKNATSNAVLAAITSAFRSPAGTTLFIYLAGHGVTKGGQYYFLTHDADPKKIETSSVSLAKIKSLFDACKSQRVFLWLDFCHSGGIIERSPHSERNDKQTIERELQVVQGEGKLILAACSPEQSALEDSIIGHGLFTDALLRGLRGEAISSGEVTANSLYDFIDRQIGNSDQRPMYFGQLRGRIVLMHYDSKTKPKTRPGEKHKKGRSTSAVSSSKNWTLMGTNFFQAERVSRNADGTFSLQIRSKSGEDDAAIKSLTPPQYGPGPTVPYAYQNDACAVQVSEVSSVSTGDSPIWNLQLKSLDEQTYSSFHDIAYNDQGVHYSPDDIAMLRARRILLNEQPTMSKNPRGFSMLDNIVTGGRDNSQAIVSPIAEFFRSPGMRSNWRMLARLKCIHLLKTTGTVQDVLHLSIGSVRGKKVRVKFRGKRASAYAGTEPTILEIDEDCPIE